MTNLPNPGTLSLPPSPWGAEVWLVPAKSDKTPTGGGEAIQDNQPSLGIKWFLKIKEKLQIHTGSEESTRLSD